MRKSLLLIAVIAFSIAPASAHGIMVETHNVLSEIRSEYPSWEEKYKPHYFDCSEMSAFVSYRLTEAGIENRIVCGIKKTNRSLAHAWVEIKVNGYRVVVESTILKMCYSYYYDDMYTLYYNYPKMEHERDWWNSIE